MYNSSKVTRDTRHLTIAIHDDDGKLLAGVNARTYWGWLYIEHLWVSEANRREGLGKKLIKMAEKKAIQRGCLHAYLDTFSFQ